MKKFFNVSGPCDKKKHYIVPILERNDGIMDLIDMEQYFVIHSARQTGKTTFIKTLAEEINNKGDYHALYCSLESVQSSVNTEYGISQIIGILKKTIKYSRINSKEKFGINLEDDTVNTLIITAITDFCIALDKPLIIFFDEVDCLENGTLISFLRQLRTGFITRSNIPFAHSIALVGMRDVRDYKSKIREGNETLGSASPFNIIAESFSLDNFTEKEIEGLYLQHTKETGQNFEKEAVKYIYKQTDGQPWLVNAIAREIIVKILKNDNTKIITKDLVKTAINNIIIRRDTHIDSLLARLKEERVKNIIQPIIITDFAKDTIDFTSDDLKYCKDLGLITSKKGNLQIANEIYKEVIIKELSSDSQEKMNEQIDNIWIDENNKIKMNCLLKDFQVFWRENSDIWVEKYQYKEAAPHLILQAFLQRVVNGGGEILREYSYGRRRIDLCVIYNENKYCIELKLNYGAKTIPDGLKQLREYMDGFGEKVGWLVVFDRESKKSWDEKLFWTEEKKDGKIVNVVGC